jgi:hypothetical protein
MVEDPEVFPREWNERDVGIIMGPRTHDACLCSIVSDWARAFEGVPRDLNLRCVWVNESAKKFFLKPTVAPESTSKLARIGQIFPPTAHSVEEGETVELCSLYSLRHTTLSPRKIS